MGSTIIDVAKQAGVSVSTVSRALNDKPDVSKRTKERIWALAKELNYSPNNVARNLVLKRSNVIGFIASDITNASFPELARGVVVRAREFGYSVMFFDTQKDSRVEKEAIGLLRSKQVDGIILSFNEANRDELLKLREENFPVVQIYRKSSDSMISTIAIDNITNGYLATKYLIDCGHRRIGHITTGDATQSGYERKLGYMKALAQAGIGLDVSLLAEGPSSVESGRACMEQLLKLNDRPTAIFASHDILAIGAYDAALDRGLSIPEDLSIVGHDNIEFSRLVRPKLTTIDTFKDRLGQASVDLLIEEMTAEEHQCKELVFPGQLIVRDSVKTIL